ncbi:Selenoprotein O [Hondaea fermentalgiana]|uniref:Selenoprotein O n=1 Tax=Hondaea fermentalgiana TaxID=2315210 RepID=A0A2R5GVH9_9STRA|nr:Selenoprotein O [Hondaea fermentalgiana]|eukprot:GBG31924.1 Selenoprotein O [Hondaea fermentalgiana]
MAAEDDAAITKGVLGPFLGRRENSLLRDLDADPRERELFPNRESRPVEKGHYVRIEPTPLHQPYRIAISKDMSERLGLSQEMIDSEDFLDLFSADTKGVDSWCTPYAVSVFGQPIESPDPFNGKGYGDGRACSIGEYVGADGARWELQLKGCGPTPFARNFDGRAVLRSSVREFLVSEAMHHLGVPTTRAVSLVASEVETVPRAWYRDTVPASNYDFPPDTMRKERCAITCRAASSFLRVGQAELYMRRLARGEEGAKEGLEKFLKHCIRIEFPNLVPRIKSGWPEVLVDMLAVLARRQAHLATAWNRVGYVQGNMNSDNCLLSGLTMDYGPFGFIESYHPLWTPFTSDPDRKFGFERQRVAAQVNVATFAQAITPLLEEGDPDVLARAKEIVRDGYPAMLAEERNAMIRAKLGLSASARPGDDEESLEKDLWQPLYPALINMDYTIFFRELSNVTNDVISRQNAPDLVAMLEERAAYEPLDAEQRKALENWATQWLVLVHADIDMSEEKRLATMRANNPKYVPREWMLKEAYEAAENKDYGPFRTMQKLFETPYDEHPDLEAAYYRRVPESHRRKPGVAFFSCSS